MALINIDAVLLIRLHISDSQRHTEGTVIGHQPPSVCVCVCVLGQTEGNEHWTSATVCVKHCVVRKRKCVYVCVCEILHTLWIIRSFLLVCAPTEINQCVHARVCLCVSVVE